MNAATDNVGESAAAAPLRTVAGFSKVRLVYWGVRRELWENRSIWIAPLVVAVVMLVGFVLGARRMVASARGSDFSIDALHADRLAGPLGMTALPIVLTASLVALFYCLDALHGERRDRSILFWKSLPVSDSVTVLSKALVPLAILPIIVCVLSMAIQLVVLVVGSALLQAVGVDSGVLWSGVPLFRLWGAVIYGIVGLALWHAPIYGWLFLVSGWAKRSTFLWAVLPLLALCLVERIAFDTAVLWSMLKDRLFGFASHGFDFEGAGQALPAPLALLADPGWWIGIGVAVALFAATVWFRRYRQPI